MIKGKINVLSILSFLLFLIYSNSIQAQVEVVPLEDEEEKVYYFDSVSPNVPILTEERKIPDSLVQQLQRDEAFWYANAQIQKKEVVEKDRNFSIAWLQEDWVRSALWFLIICLFAAVMVWYLSTLNVRLFRKTPAIIQSSLEETIKEDIFSISYKAEIDKAIQASDFRLAVRLYYLQSLAILSKKHLILFKQDRTNSEYVIQLFNTSYYKDFFKLTRNFEYTWYGKFELTRSAFNLVQKDFETFHQHLQA